MSSMSFAGVTLLFCAMACAWLVWALYIERTLRHIDARLRALDAHEQECAARGYSVAASLQKIAKARAATASFR